MRNLTNEPAHIMCAELMTDGNQIKCPICDQWHKASMSPKTSLFWAHFFSKKHRNLRPLDPNLEADLFAAIKKVERQSRAQAIIDARDIKAAQKRFDQQLAQTHRVTGEFLNEIAAELQGLIYLMEPYHSQNGADASAQAMIEKLKNKVFTDTK